MFIIFLCKVQTHLLELEISPFRKKPRFTIVRSDAPYNFNIISIVAMFKTIIFLVRPPISSKKKACLQTPTSWTKCALERSLFSVTIIGKRSNRIMRVIGNNFVFDCLNVAVNVDKLMILLNILNLCMGILSWFESKGENVSNYKENQSKISYVKKMKMKYIRE